MENQIVLLDTSILIDYYRKKDKSKSQLFHLSQTYNDFRVSAITIFEIFTGATSSQLVFWNDLFNDIHIIPFDSDTAKTAADINFQLKLIRKQIDKADLFIAATAVSQNLPLATLNKKHFERITNLAIL